MYENPRRPHNTDSPYYPGLSDVLVKAFGPPAVLAAELAGVDGVDEAFVFGSWAARYHDQQGARAVGDIDLLVLGEPDRDVLYEAVARASARLGREVQVTIRKPGWLNSGTGTFHHTVVGRPIVAVPLAHTRLSGRGRASQTAATPGSWARSGALLPARTSP